MIPEPPTMTFHGDGNPPKCSCGGECMYLGRGKWQCEECPAAFNEADDNVIVRPPDEGDRK